MTDADASVTPRLAGATAEPRHWAHIGEVTVAWGIRLLFLVHRLLGQGVFRLVAYPTVLFYMLRHPRAYAASRDYLARLSRLEHGDGRAATMRRSWQHFAAFAQSILDKLRVWAGQLPTDDIAMHGYPAIRDAVDAGQGGVIFVSHLGNAEVCRALTHLRARARLTVLVHTKHAEAFNALLADLNPASALQLVQVTDISADTVLQLRERIERGELVVIACDRVPVREGGRVAVVDFLGAPARFPVGPYVLASLLQCPVYLMFCLLEAGRYHVYFERFAESIVLPRHGREERLRRCAAHYADRLAHHCRRAPLQWFNFYDFWAMPSTARSHAGS